MFWCFSLRNINKNNICIEIQRNSTNPMPPFYRQISLSQDWLDFFEFQFKCYCLFMLLREKDQKVLNSYEMLLLSKKLFRKYRYAALMMQIVNIDKSEEWRVKTCRCFYGLPNTNTLHNTNTFYSVKRKSLSVPLPLLVDWGNIFSIEF